MMNGTTAERRNLKGTCSLTLRINETYYNVRGFAQTQSNWAWELRKLGTGKARVVYTVAESPDGPVCDCPSFQHDCVSNRAVAGLGHPMTDKELNCKHIRALTARGLIRPTSTTPRSGLDGPAFDTDAIDAADSCEAMAVFHERAGDPISAAAERQLASEFREQAASKPPSPSKPAPVATTSFTLPDDIVAPDEPFALDSRSTADPVTDPVSDARGEYSAIVALLRGARDRGLKYPSIEIRTPDGRPVVLKLCGEKSRNPGSVAASNGIKPGSLHARYYGRIDEWGNDRMLFPDQGLMTTLRRLAADPAAVAAEHGHATGRCCFCGRELTDSKSVQVGYGPICADRHSLPWG
jgi:hypothetical protein